MEMLEIEKELAGADRMSALARYDAQLIALGKRCQASLKAGLAPEAFRACSLLNEAVIVARKLLRLQVKE